MIERASNRGPLSDAEVAVKLRNAPGWVLNPINRERRQRGVAAIPVRNTAAAAVRRKPAAALKWLPQGAAADGHLRTAPAAKPTAIARRAPVAVKPAAPPKLPQVAFVLFPGVGMVRGIREVFEPRSFDGWFSNLRADRSSQKFVIRCNGHDGGTVATLADGSVSIRLVDDAGPVAIWSPAAGNVRHRAIVALIRSGCDRISGEFLHPRSFIDNGCHRVVEAIPTGVALLRHWESPCFPGALAGVIDGTKPIHMEVRRIADQALARSRGSA